MSLGLEEGEQNELVKILTYWAQRWLQGLRRSTLNLPRSAKTPTRAFSLRAPTNINKLTHLLFPFAHRTRPGYQWGRSPSEGLHGSRLWRDAEIDGPCHFSAKAPPWISKAAFPVLTYDAHSHVAYDGQEEHHTANDICASPGEQSSISTCDIIHPPFLE